MTRPRVSSLYLQTAAMLGMTAVLHYVCLSVYPKRELDIFGISDFYPFSVFNFCRPSLGASAYALALAWLFYRYWPRLEKLGLRGAILAGLSLAVLTNLIHGWRYGIDYPTATWGEGGIEYYHDAVLIKGAAWFLERFNRIQFELLEHARTHPPGPVLLYYGLLKLTSDPGRISILVCGLSLCLSLPALQRLLRLCFGKPLPGALLLFAILPAVQIYGLATADAVIAGLFLQAIVCFADDQDPRSPTRAALFLFLSAFFTFGVLFLLPVFFGYEILRQRSVRRSLKVLALAALAMLLLKWLSGFDWWQAFRKASAMENEKGFLLLADTRRYIWYRIGAWAEIFFFFTPFLCALAWQGRAELKRAGRRYYTLAALGPMSLALLLAAGAMKIGEAARICQFILPYLMLPAFAAWRVLDAAGRRRMATAVLVWGLGMELFGFFQW